MANIYAVVNNGNWSNSATWNTGALPTASDDVFSNGLTVNVDVTTTVLSLRNTSATGIAAGGTFVLANGSNITCTAVQGIYLGSTTPVVQFSGVALTFATLRANLPSAAIPNTANYTAISHSGAGTLNIVGDITFLSAGTVGTSVANRAYIRCTIGTLRITGNVSSFGGAGGNEAVQSCIVMSGGNLYITGNVLGAGTGAVSGFVIIGGSSNIQITGQVNATGTNNLTGGASVEVIGSVINTGAGAAISTTGIPVTIRGELQVNSSGAGLTGTTGSILIEGNITTTSSGAGVNVTTGTVTVNGNVTITNTGIAIITTTGAITIGKDVTASSAQNAVVSTSGLVTVSGSMYNTNQFQAVFAQKILIATTTTAIRYQTFAGATQVMFSGSAVTLGLPTPNNVRLGTLYGNAPQLTGTLVLPPSNAVIVGVPIDNTVGTLVMSPAAVVAELGTSTLDIAVRLRNVSTVQTMGDQAASYGI